jgi:hypothetical protein
MSSDRKQILLDSLAHLNHKAKELEVKLRVAKWQQSISEQQNYKINILQMKWASEVEQSIVKLASILAEIDRIEKMSEALTVKA